MIFAPQKYYIFHNVPHPHLRSLKFVQFTRHQGTPSLPSPPAILPRFLHFPLSHFKSALIFFCLFFYLLMKINENYLHESGNERGLIFLFFVFFLWFSFRLFCSGMPNLDSFCCMTCVRSLLLILVIYLLILEARVDSGGKGEDLEFLKNFPPKKFVWILP